MSLNLVVPKPSFKLNNGSLKTVRTKHCDEDFEFTLAFCPECGSPVYAVPHWKGVGDIVVVQVGTLDDESWVEKLPGKEINIWKRVGWAEKIDRAEQKERYT
jgi:hypothetical protein